jgi:hypothetical protein
MSTTPKDGVNPSQAPSKATVDQVMAWADKYWEASTAARYRVRAELEQIVRDACGVTGRDADTNRHQPPMPDGADR